MNITTVKRQVIRAYIYLILNAVLNLAFVIATVAFFVLGLTSLVGTQEYIEPSKMVKLYSLIFFAKFIWNVVYHFVCKKTQKQFEVAGIEISPKGAEQVSGLVNVLNHKTEELKKEKELIMTKHGNDLEKAKKELVLLHMKYGGNNES